MRFTGEGRVDPKPRRDIVWPVAIVTMIAAVFSIFVFLPAAASVQMLASAGVTLLALGAAWRWTPRASSTLPLRSVSADERGVFVDGTLLVARRAIKSAQADDDGTAKIHVRRGGWYAILFEHADRADELVGALGLDASQSVARYRALPPWSRHLRWLAVVLTTSPWVLLNLLRFLPAGALGTIALLYAVLALPLVLPQRVEIGHDGVLFSWLRKRRFVPYGRMREVRTTPHGVAIELEDMRTVEIRLSQKPEGERPRSAEIAARIQEAMAAHAAHARVEEETFLARGTRTLPDWIRDMRAFGTGEAGAYRTISIPRERLWSVLESPTADPSAREGAALALHASLDGEERARVLAIAAKSASPRLRVALDAIADAEDEQRVRVGIEHAEELDDEAPLSTRAKR